MHSTTAWRTESASTTGYGNEAGSGVVRQPYFSMVSRVSRTSLLWALGLTLVQTFTILPDGSIRKVFREATPFPPSEPYVSTTFLSVSASSLKVRPCLAQKSLWLSVESTLTP